MSIINPNNWQVLQGRHIHYVTSLAGLKKALKMYLGADYGEYKKRKAISIPEKMQMPCVVEFSLYQTNRVKVCVNVIDVDTYKERLYSQLRLIDKT